jgi:hypothetical protein
MTSVADYRAALDERSRSSWPAFLSEHSGLPGPRGNLELIAAVADVGDRALFDQLVETGDEYLVCCGVVGLGALLPTDATIEGRLRDHARDERWRVREATAMALQRLGDLDLLRLSGIVEDWVEDPDPLVQRAAAAAICEPRLLRTPAAAAIAVQVCRRATDLLALRPADTRRDPHVRTLRQALGYCWSVAVAANPVPGLAFFHALDTTDPDIAWIVRSNLTKKRLARLL